VVVVSSDDWRELLARARDAQGRWHVRAPESGVGEVRLVG
jgi:hypothetical protein